MIKTVKPCKSPEILAITPLKKGDKISPETKKTLKRCNVPFAWISCMGEGNPYKNMVYPWKWWRKENGTPKYLIKIDNDLTCKRGMLDHLYEALERSSANVGYTYCRFRYRGSVNADFDEIHWNIDRLITQNYISSCSLMKTKVLEETGSFVTDDKYFRLLDWALWLQFLRRGYIGEFVPETSFTATSSPKTVSSRSQEDYMIKHHAIIDDFVKPYMDNFIEVKSRYIS
jgi:cellulose synthase/poly-beta-1,6-N-acetylglucosamine synthase-like glycosyltransferase